MRLARSLRWCLGALKGRPYKDSMWIDLAEMGRSVLRPSTSAMCAGALLVAEGLERVDAAGFECGEQAGEAGDEG
jgi:hypothetical protein